MSPVKHCLPRGHGEPNPSKFKRERSEDQGQPVVDLEYVLFYLNGGWKLVHWNIFYSSLLEGITMYVCINMIYFT